MDEVQEKSKEVKFYELCNVFINQMANEKGILNLAAYYTPTDFHQDNHATMFSYLLNKYEDFRNDWKRKIFAQFVFHAQNETGSHLINIINFEKNIEVIYEKLNGFDVNNVDYTVDTLVEYFRGYMNWKVNTNNPDKAMRRWCSSIICSANYINRFNSKEALFRDLKDNVWGNDRTFSLDKITTRFKERIPVGFGPALMCDLLKELGDEFSHVLKPDIHIKDVVKAFTGLNYSNDNKCYKEFIRILEEIKKEYRDVTAYKLDKIIWLICSGKFYLHDNVNKNIFIKNIEEL